MEDSELEILQIMQLYSPVLMDGNDTRYPNPAPSAVCLCVCVCIACACVCTCMCMYVRVHAYVCMAMYGHNLIVTNKM